MEAVAPASGVKQRPRNDAGISDIVPDRAIISAHLTILSGSAGRLHISLVYFLIVANRLTLAEFDLFARASATGMILARHALAAAGGVAAPIFVDGDGLRTDALSPARLVYVTPSHQFPLGSVLSAARRRTL
jgi:hypothetical protein